MMPKNEENEHYSFSLSLRLSKSYNSMEARVEYGRDKRVGETREKLIADVETTVKQRLTSATTEIDKLLTKVT